MQPDTQAGTALVAACARRDMTMAQSVFDELFGEAVDLKTEFCSHHTQCIGDSVQQLDILSLNFLGCEADAASYLQWTTYKQQQQQTPGHHTTPIAAWWY